MGIGGNQGIEVHSKPLSNKEHGIAGLHGVAALEARRTTGGDAARRRWGNGTGNAEHITGENNRWICDMWVGGNQGIEAHSKPLSNKEHGVAGLHGISSLETWRARSWDAAGRRWRSAGNTENITGKNLIGIGDMGVGGNQGV